MKSVLLSGLLTLAPLVANAAPRLVADVNPLPDAIGAAPSGMVAVGEKVFFSAQDAVHGQELWVTDGTEAATKLVRDIRVGQVGSQPRALQAVGNRVFFFAEDAGHGPQLWSSDGDDLVLAADWDGGYVPPQIKAAGGLLYFTSGPTAGSPSPFGWGLWRSDGTADGTKLLNPAEGGGFPGYRPFSFCRNLAEIDGAMFFANLNSELWRSTGTREETVKLADLGTGGQIISIAGSYGTVWITLDRGDDKELWTWSNGLAAKIASIPNGSWPADALTVKSGRAFFVSKETTAGVELWTSDGVTTRRVRDIQPGTGSSVPTELTWSGTKLCFIADDGINGRCLWASDGVTATLVKAWSGGAEATSLTDNAGVVYFLRDSDGVYLWKSDGTPAGTVAIKRVITAGTAYGTYDLMAAGGNVYFKGNDGVSGFELWISNGSAAGTRMVRDQPGTRDGLIDISPGGMAAWGNDLVFCGNDGVKGEEPWRTDGTAAGTHILCDINPGAADSTPNRFGVAGETLFFAADDGVHGSEMWRSGASGTSLLRDINPGGSSGYIGQLAALGGRMAFTAQDDVESGLWISDGDTTTKIKGGVSSRMAASGTGLLFAAYHPGFGEEPWWTDGVTTRIVKDLRAGSLSSSPSWFTKTRNESYFQASDTGVWRLWRTDDTESGTTQVSGWPGTGPVYPIVAVGDRAYFFEETGSSGLRLWMAGNGQAMFVKQIGNSGKKYPFPFPATPYVASCGGLLYFMADDGEHGAELWRSDGTAAGTTMVRDIRTGEAGSEPVNLTTVGGMLYFQANDGIHGEELWITDGTDDGTKLVADIAPGSGGSAPGPMVLAGDRLYISAVTRETGREPFLLEVGGIQKIHAWCEAAGLVGTHAALGASPHGDGLPNLLKYAFGIDGSRPYQSLPGSGSGHLPDFSATLSNGEAALRVSYSRRVGSGLRYTVERSTDLNGSSFVAMAGDELVEPPVDGWERVVRSERVVGDRCFGRVAVTLPQE